MLPHIILPPLPPEEIEKPIPFEKAIEFLETNLVKAAKIVEINDERSLEAARRRWEKLASCCIYETCVGGTVLYKEERSINLLYLARVVERVFDSVRKGYPPIVIKWFRNGKAVYIIVYGVEIKEDCEPISLHERICSGPVLPEILILFLERDRVVEYLLSAGNMYFFDSLMEALARCR